nr:hypothetical protein [Candidatus Woesearchaeota archaeon]
MEKQVIILIMVIALVALVGVQAYQINDIKNSLGNEDSISNSYTKVTAQNTISPKTQQAPAMVGGC